MNANRVTAKYYKWKIIPDEIKKYDYILHIDCAKIEWLNKFTYDNIIDLIKNNPNVLFFARKHPFLKDTFEDNKCNYLLNKHFFTSKSVIINIWDQIKKEKKLFDWVINHKGQ